MRALLSVYDKENIIDFARELLDLGWELISTGGTFDTLKQAQLPVKEVREITGSKEILGGRVKTLHPRIHGGILYRRDKKEDQDTIESEQILPIDLVVNSLYPFESVVASGASTEEIIENIDIGGPSMIRACAKNYKDCYILTDKEDYRDFIDRLKNETADLSYRRHLAQKAFQRTAEYDSLIAEYFNQESDEVFPEKITYSYELKSILRYGENPHQQAAFYQKNSSDQLLDLRQLQGKELSYNNLNDMKAAFSINKLFTEPCVVAIKHTNPCGIGLGDDLTAAYQKAYESDTESIFGGILACNRPIELSTAQEMAKIFLEVIIAPSFSKEALSLLATKKNLRLIEATNMDQYKLPGTNIKEVINGILVQTKDDLLDTSQWKTVTKRQVSSEELDELTFAWRAVQGLSSNGVVITKNKGTVGIGQGETKRSWAVENAISRAGDKITGAVFASDGFFFKDTMELLHKSGIQAIIQPGGSVKDQEVIDYADQHDMSIIFTGTRHFRH